MPAQPKQAQSDSTEFLKFPGKAMYAHLFKPYAYKQEDGTLDTPVWTVDVLVDTVTAAMLKGKGVNVKTSNQKYVAYVEQEGLREKGYDGSFVRVKKSTIRKSFDKEKGTVRKDALGQDVLEAAPRPRVTDSVGNELPEDFAKLIGNGSDVYITATVTTPMRGGKAIFGQFGCRLVETRILNLLEYTPKNAGTFVYGASENVVHTPTPVVSKSDFDADEIPF